MAKKKIVVQQNAHTINNNIDNNHPSENTFKNKIREIGRKKIAFVLAGIPAAIAFLANLTQIADAYKDMCIDGDMVPLFCVSAGTNQTSSNGETCGTAKNNGEGAAEALAAEEATPCGEGTQPCLQQIGGWCVTSERQAVSTTFSDCSTKMVLESRSLDNPPETLFLTASTENGSCVLSITGDHGAVGGGQVLQNLLEGQMPDDLKKCAVSKTSRSLVPCSIGHELQYLGVASGSSDTAQQEQCRRTVSTFSARQAGQIGSGVNAMIWNGPDGTTGCWLVLTEASSKSAESL